MKPTTLHAVSSLVMFLGSIVIAILFAYLTTIVVKTANASWAFFNRQASVSAVAVARGHHWRQVSRLPRKRQASVACATWSSSRPSWVRHVLGVRMSYLGLLSFRRHMSYES